MSELFLSDTASFLSLAFVVCAPSGGVRTGGGRCGRMTISEEHRDTAPQGGVHVPAEDDTSQACTRLGGRDVPGEDVAASPTAGACPAGRLLPSGSGRGLRAFHREAKSDPAPGDASPRQGTVGEGSSTLRGAV